MMAEMKMSVFLDRLSPPAPVPGGGGVCAYAAALGMSLGSMVANLTTGKKKYAEHEEEIREILKKAAVVTKGLASCMDKDAEAFEPLAKAYGLPKNTPEEIEQRTEVMENALCAAGEAPLALMKEILEALLLLSRLPVIGSRLAISDVGVGVQLCKAALNGASLNVYINTKFMKNRRIAEDMNKRPKEMAQRGSKMADEIFEEVAGTLCGKK